MDTTTTDPVKTEKKAERYWSDSGQVGCGELGHTPERGSGSWTWGRWRKINPREIAEFARELGRPPACEGCAANARALEAEGVRGLREKRAKERGAPMRLSELIVQLRELAGERDDPEVVVAYQENNPLAGIIEGVTRLEIMLPEQPGFAIEAESFVCIVVGGHPPGMGPKVAQHAFHQVRG